MPTYYEGVRYLLHVTYTNYKNEKKTHSSGIFHLKNSFIAVFFLNFYANPISGKIEFSFIFVHKNFALIKRFHRSAPKICSINHLNRKQLKIKGEKAIGNANKIRKQYVTGKRSIMHEIPKKTSIGRVRRTQICMKLAVANYDHVCSHTKWKPNGACSPLRT